MFEEVIIEIASPALTGVLQYQLTLLSYILFFSIWVLRNILILSPFPFVGLWLISQDLIKMYRHGILFHSLSEVLLPDLLSINMMPSKWVVRVPGEWAPCFCMLSGPLRGSISAGCMGPPLLLRAPMNIVHQWYKYTKLIILCSCIRGVFTDHFFVS